MIKDGTEMKVWEDKWLLNGVSDFLLYKKSLGGTSKKLWRSYQDQKQEKLWQYLSFQS